MRTWLGLTRANCRWVRRGAINVLVPGAGLGRLAFDIARMGTDRILFRPWMCVGERYWLTVGACGWRYRIQLPGQRILLLHAPGIKFRAKPVRAAHALRKNAGMAFRCLVEWLTGAARDALHCTVLRK